MSYSCRGPKKSEDREGSSAVAIECLTNRTAQGILSLPRGSREGGGAGLSELFQVGGCDEKVGGCKSRRGKTLGGSGGMPTGTFLNLESLKWHFLHFQKRFINQVF